MKKVFLNCILLLCALIVGSGDLWADPAPYNTVLWGETWNNATTASSASNSATPASNCSTSKGTTMYGGATISYNQSSNSVYVRTDATPTGGNGNNLIMPSSNSTWTISGIPSGEATEMTLSFASNKTTFSVTTTETSKLEITGSGKTWTIAVKSGQTTPTTFDLTIKNTGSSNARVDNVILVVKTAGTGGGGSTPSIALASSIVDEPKDEKENGTVNISYENITINAASDFAIQYYNGLGEEVEEPEWILSAIEGSAGSYHLTYDIEANTDVARSTYLKVFALDNEDYVYSSLLTIKQAGEKVVVSIQSPTGGTLVVKNGETPISDGNHVAIGATLTIEANADATHRYRNWQYKAAGSWTTKTTNYEYTVDANDVSFRANFDETYPANFIVNGATYSTIRFVEDESIAFPEEPDDINGRMFVGWYTAAYENESEAPEFVNTSTAQMGTSEVNYYAVFAIGVSPIETSSTFTIKKSSAPSSPFVENGVSWTWSNLTFANSDNACINKTNGSVTISLPSAAKAKSLVITKTNNSWSGDAVVKLGYGATEVKSFTGSSLSYLFDNSYDNAPIYTMNNSTSKNAWVEKIVLTYTSYTYSNYTTYVPVSKSISAAGWATYCSPYALDLANATGLTDAYIVRGGAAGVLDKVSVKNGTVPANTGLLLKALAGTATVATIPVVNSGTTDVSENKLVGKTEEYLLPAGEGYVLLNGDNGIGFYINPDAAFTIGANTAYLPVGFTGSNPDAAPSSFRIVDEENNATNINSINANENVIKFIENGQLLIKRDGITYDALGRKVR